MSDLKRKYNKISLSTIKRGHIGVVYTYMNALITSAISIKNQNDFLSFYDASAMFSTYIKD